MNQYHFVVGLICLLLASCSHNTPQDNYNGNRDGASEATIPFGDYDKDGGYYIGPKTPNTCQLRVRRGVSYNIRRGPGNNHNICQTSKTLDSTTNGKPTVVTILESEGQNSRWVKLGAPFASHCATGVGYVHVNAFLPQDRQMYQNGLCGKIVNNQRATIGDVVRRGTERNSVVKNLDNNFPYRFPLNRCYGIKNRGGLGHFGAPRNNRGRRYKHGGVDYYAPMGTPVRSPCNGKVTFSGVRGAYGNVVYVRCDRAPHYTFRMAHLNKLRVRNGARVNSGTPVGGTGNTGNAIISRYKDGRVRERQAPQVHVEIRLPSGRKLNPQKKWDCNWNSGK